MSDVLNSAEDHMTSAVVSERDCVVPGEVIRFGCGLP